MAPRRCCLSWLTVIVTGLWFSLSVLAHGHVQVAEPYNVSTLIHHQLVSTISHLAVDGAVILASDKKLHVIRVWDAATDTFRTLAGKDGESGDADGALADARFHTPQGLCIDPHGAIFVADTTNAVIRRIDRRTGSVSTVAGHLPAGNVDGDGSVAKFSNALTALVCLADGSVLAVDKSNNAVRIIRPPGGGGPAPTPQPHDDQGKAGWSHPVLYGCVAAVAVAGVAALALSQGVRSRLTSARSRSYGAPDPPYQRLPELEDASRPPTPLVAGAAVGNLLSLDDEDESPGAAGSPTDADNHV